MTHGWPGSVIEFLKVIGPLTDPVAHGGKAEDAFHLVLPSLPGYGFSDRPVETGWKVDRIARAWIELMKRLGYSRFVAQGGDWGSAVTTEIALAAPPECLGIHLNMPIAFPGKVDDPTPEEQKQLEKFHRFMTEGSGYSNEQGTKPQTLGYGLTDSPSGQAAWIYEKYHGWTDCNGDPENVLTKDEMLDNIMLYWLPATATSSGRLYWESIGTGFFARKVSIPVGVSVFPHELMPVSKRWAEQVYDKLIHWSELEVGGHFAAFEQPAIFVDELRNCFRQLR
jgi:pimeloyl-ACP methyl ester carboxylesterase